MRCEQHAKKGVEVYTKDISFLLRVLHTSKQSGVLLVEAFGQDDSPWQGLFHLDNGAVITCLVRDKADGRVVLRNDEALRWLMNQGKLEWQLEKDAQLFKTTLPLPPPGETPAEGFAAPAPPPPALERAQLEQIPQRTQKGKDVPVNAFASREHRQVLTLVDGRRTIEEIIALLHKPPETILRALQDLRVGGFIL
jgi:hypothetical protein